MQSGLKFRNLYGTQQKEKFEGVKITGSIFEGAGAKGIRMNNFEGNDRYIAYSSFSQGGGKLCVVDANKPSRLEVTQPMITGHNGPVLDFDFDPFHDNIIATGSEDTNIRLWQIPENFSQDLTSPVQQFSAHQRKVNLLQFNPTSEDVLASGSNDYTVKIWNVQNPDVFQSYAKEDCPTDLQWNLNGSLLATCWKDKHFRLIDPRSKQFTLEKQVHEGIKPPKFQWVGSDYAVTVGSTSQQKRQFKVWDLRDLSKDVQTCDIDTASGNLYPFYDNDLGLLYLAGKGDGNIRYFEWNNKNNFVILNEFKSSQSGKAYGFFPKRTLDVSKCEVAKCIKITTETIEQISFTQPRKGQEFQSDLYPDCYAGISSQSAQQFFEGHTAVVKKISLNTEQAQEKIKRNVSKIEEKKSFQSQTRDKEQTVNTKLTITQADVAAYMKEVKDLHDVIHEKDDEIKHLKEQIAHLEAELAKQNETQQQPQQESNTEEITE